MCSSKENGVGRPRLQVYVAGHCVGCSEALHLVTNIRREFPAIDVQVIDLEERPSRSPKGARVFSVPTWVLDGRTLSLGNPRMEELSRAVAAALSPAKKERK